MKTRIATLVTVLFFAACGLSDAEIAEALRNAEGASASLSFKTGETWTAARTRTTREEMPYKYENGAATPCAQNSAATSADECGTPSAVHTVVATAEWAKVTGKSDLAFSEAPGVVIAEKLTTTTTQQRYWAHGATTTTLSDSVVEEASTIYTLFVHNSFVSRLDDQVASDGDVGAGRALYPASPVRGRIYTDDDGFSWAVTGASRVPLENRTLAAAAMTVATTKAYWSLERIQNDCFRRIPAGGSNFDVALIGACNGALVIAYENRAEVGLDLILRQQVRFVTIELVDWGIRDVDGTLQRNGIQNASGAEIVFLYTAEEFEETYALQTLTF